MKVLRFFDGALCFFGDGHIMLRSDPAVARDSAASSDATDAFVNTAGENLFFGAIGFEPIVS